MNAAQIATSLLGLIAGVGIFLIACSMMSSNLEALGSRRLKRLFTKTSKSKLVGVGVGAAATAIIQSSSATSVMVIGFVNAGIMTLSQAATVIFGANVGTTVTGQLVALGMFSGNSISSSAVFSAFAGIGAFTLAFAKKDRTKKIGGIMAGFGMLFAGLSLMSDAMGNFSELESVKRFLADFRNPVLLVLIGAVFTALVQSSSVMTSITLTMVVSGLIDLNQGIFITLGSNVGTCVTTLIAGLTSTKNAKRTALVHLIFNISGVLLFLLTNVFLRLGGIDFGWIFGKMFPDAPQVQLAMFHTFFNITTVLVVLPLTKQLVKLVCLIVPDKKETPPREDVPRFHFVEEHMLKNPPIAVQQVKREILDMAETALLNFDLSCDIIGSLDYAQIETFRANENRLNFLQNELAKLAIKLLRADLNEKDRIYLSTVFRTVTDLERVGDYAENIVEYADKLKQANESFSAEAKEEIEELKNLIHELYGNAISAYRNRDKNALRAAYQVENSVDGFTAQMAERHIERLSKGVCTPEVGAQYLSLSANVERIADHYINVANAIKAY